MKLFFPGLKHQGSSAAMCWGMLEMAVLASQPQMSLALLVGEFGRSGSQRHAPFMVTASVALLLELHFLSVFLTPHSNPSPTCHRLAWPALCGSDSFLVLPLDVAAFPLTTPALGVWL